MTVHQYKQLVIELFKGDATEEQWNDLAEAILRVSEDYPDIVESIDEAVLGPVTMCLRCNSFYRLRGTCWGCCGDDDLV